jgi:60 kDa SS-A/Ro ribonucleoprotein
MPDALSAITLRATPQSQAADPRQVPNSAGGFTFTVAPVERLRRFLVLGTEGGTFYAAERELTVDNAGVVLEWARHRTAELVDEVVTLSTAGRAPRNSPALFALAAAASFGDLEGRRAALAALPRVARTGTHLFVFAGYVEQLRGWGRGLRRAVAEWYTARPTDDVAYQAVKYRQREGWSHRDLLRLAHPVTDEPERRALFDWVSGRGAGTDVPALVAAYERVQAAGSVAGWVAALRECPALSWEMLPDEALVEPEVWATLVEQGLPQTALLRQLPRLTRLGLLSPLGGTLATVVAQLTDADRLRRARVHPVNVLVAARTYAGGESARGQSTWAPVAQVVDALDAAFYAAFGAVEPAGKRTLLALDVSGSMTAPVAGLPLTCREASAALSLVTAATEPSTLTLGFTAGESGLRGLLHPRKELDGISVLPISPRQRLDDVLRTVSDLPFSRTDCALPMLWATANRVEVDTFVVYTDNETWAGPIHPHQALRDYRERMGIDARLAVVALTPTPFSIADPSDPGMLDVAGFDAAVPSLLASFSARAV